MITIDCPSCDEPIRTEHFADSVHCETCRVEFEFATDDSTPAIAQAA
jgi:hypothetical protein